ncbi:hypothetical protein Bcsk_012560 [Bartonella sp. CDC_skunk]|uniref:hypothetical protein n=1 Tax=unclassified Bartonella TaxID=2645622 RepID=UPI0009C20D19|nr:MULTISPECIES: hypothetical protein [unclassified Bartonella]AQX21866.1 hypothetical protein Bcsk_012560 [Bartonella sp. CDC_skunk]AQX27137.1 hypothetical protein Bra60_011640 [Bartonella sp. Raccoon60]
MDKSYCMGRRHGGGYGAEYQGMLREVLREGLWKGKADVTVSFFSLIEPYDAFEKGL